MALQMLRPWYDCLLVCDANLCIALLCVTLLV
jgi:hypothetical protein